MKYLKLILVIGLIFSSIFTYSKELYQSNLGLKSMAMGGTVNSWVRDSDAVLFNPAALAYVEKLEIKIVSLSLGAGVNGEGGAQGVYDEWKDLGEINGVDDFSKLSGKDIYLGVNGRSGIAVPYFGFVGYSDNYMLARFHSPPNPAFETKFFADVGLAAGVGFPVGQSSAVGLTFKRIQRNGGEKSIDLGVLLDSELATAIQESFDARGQAYGFDMALMHQVSGAPFKPSIALTWQDIGYTSFQKTSGSSAPPHISDNLSLGVSAQFESMLLSVLTAAEYKFITRTGEQFGQKLHLGAEVSIPFIDIRAGLNQGYMTYGLGLGFLIFDFDLAYSPVEIGGYPGQTPNNRFFAGLSLSLSFDANFKLQDAKGKKRRLKQRR
jgi:hypothetical protein